MSIMLSKAWGGQAHPEARIQDRARAIAINARRTKGRQASPIVTIIIRIVVRIVLNIRIAIVIMIIGMI